MTPARDALGAPLSVDVTLAGLRPVPQYEVRVDGALLARVDLAFPDERLVIE